MLVDYVEEGGPKKATKEEKFELRACSGNYGSGELGKGRNWDQKGKQTERVKVVTQNFQIAEIG